ncbi:YihY/virulence factor BrkB family protein [Microvirga guangxiensis]|uniref:Membrane protein n=1 Tax=Microvirga guangxiensis TaxID=549386 RepID=A0A1G5IPN3_9HYPH|nr:YihY/virulence factor BrkB family protein [Microvirga guangxiensis]SCY78042.1 membrane protein [Microvirga guangxiensis]
MDPQSGEAPIHHLSRILKRTAYRAYDDDITTIASGVAFFVALAVFPGIAAIVGLYSLFAGPRLGDVLQGALPSVLPEYAVQVIVRQIRYMVTNGTSDAEQLGVASLVGAATLLASINRGTTALLRGLNVVYGRKDRRGLLKLSLTAIAFTIGGIAFLFFAIAAVVLFPGLLRVLGLEAATTQILDLLRWPSILIVVGLALAVVYRFGPSRDAVDWRWIAFGSTAASLLWVCASLLFSWAMSWLGTLDELYGSVGAMIGFMLWIWLSVTVVLIGAELDACGTEVAQDCDFAR